MAALATSIAAVAGLAISATTTGIAMGQKSKARKNQMKAEFKIMKNLFEQHRIYNLLCFNHFID